MRNRFIILVLLNFAFVLCQAQSFQVGHRQQTFVDASRSNRSIPAEIYYPANTAGNNVPVAAGQFPVLVFGHGFVMTWSAYDVVWNALVPNGYILVFPTTEASFSPSHLNFAKDISFLVGTMKAQGSNAVSPFYGTVAGTSAVMGHSMGGGSAFLAVQFDSTITALATLAAANTNPSSIAAASTVTIPSIVFSGGNDCVTPPAQHQVPMYDSLASLCKSFVSIAGGSHCQFAGYNFNCSFGEAICMPQPAITPAAQQAIVFSLLLPWLDFYLKNDCAAGTQFQNIVAAGAGIASQQNCALLCASTSIRENEWSRGVLFYPNPSNGMIRFADDALKAFGDCILDVYNPAGEKVRQSELVRSKAGIDLTGLANGIYLCKISGKDFSVFCKLVIVK